jgi:RHS repeat-associated protein
MTDYEGTVVEAMDYLPFGEQIAGGTDTARKFTGKERDGESGLDNFGARYNSSWMGRFMTPDEPFMDQHPGDPQSWNLYSYVRNNPTNMIDPTGLCAQYNSTYEDDDGNYVIHRDSGPCPSPSLFEIGAWFGRPDYPQQTYTDAKLAALGQAGRMAEPGVNLAATGLRAFGWIASAGLMAVAECGAAGSSCSVGGTALGLVPGLRQLKALGLAVREERAIAGVLKQIAAGTTKGQEFYNFTGRLPAKGAGYYREFTVPLAGQAGRGASRVITGAGGEIYYTADHYTTFTRIK